MQGAPVDTRKSSMTRDECVAWELALGDLLIVFKDFRSNEAKFYQDWMWALFSERCEMD